jgi:hypothetical protein
MNNAVHGKIETDAFHPFADAGWFASKSTEEHKK